MANIDFETIFKILFNVMKTQKNKFIALNTNFAIIQYSPLSYFTYLQRVQLHNL